MADCLCLAEVCLCTVQLARDKTPAVVMVIRGGEKTLQAVCEAVKADIPVLVFAGSGRAADFIAAAYDRRERPLVRVLYINYT